MHQVFNPFVSPRTGCGDAIFSGHTLHGTLIRLMGFRYFSYHRFLAALASVNLALPHHLSLPLHCGRGDGLVCDGGWMVSPTAGAADTERVWVACQCNGPPDQLFAHGHGSSSGA